MLPPSSQRPAAGTDLELAVFVGESAAVHALPRGRALTIGRAEDSDMRIDHPSVSRRHAALHVGPPLAIEGLGSQNGTFVRDPQGAEDTADTDHLRQLTRRAADVAVGDCINVGSALLVIRRATRPDVEACGAASGRSEPVVQDPAMRALHAEAQRVASTELGVLLLGETGVGKEVVAREIHRRSRRGQGPFLAVNCAALPESLMESELFGHERGAFTGALEARPGLFEAAARGTVFLDEVGELPVHVQAKLLRVIEDRKVLRVGSRATRDIDVRFIAATNRDLEAEVARGAFRQDLFFRLQGVTLAIPPLRERTSEIPHLARVFTAEACHKVDRASPPAISEAVLALLGRHAWPGNLRELRNVLERAVALCAGATILPEHLPAKLRSPSPEGAAPDSMVRPSPRVAPPSAAPPRTTAPASASLADVERLRSEIHALERQRVIDALNRCAGNQTQAAEMLGMSRRKLVMKLEEYNLPRPRKKTVG